MAVFAAAPDFLRPSLRFLGLDPTRAHAAARAYLAAAGRGALSERGADPSLPAWREAYAGLGLDPDRLPPHALLARWAALPGGLPSQGPFLDLLHGFSLRNRVPLAAYDLAALSGDLWLRPSRGCEAFLAFDAESPVAPDLSEIILVDSADQVLARHWHGRLGRETAAGPRTEQALVHLDLLPPLDAQAEALVDTLRRLVTGFLGGEAETGTLSWERPRLAWSE